MTKTKIDLNEKSILVTDSPGFIGANLVLRLLSELKSGTVVSLDNMNDYYDPKLKEYRLELINAAAEKSSVKHSFIKDSIPCIVMTSSSGAVHTLFQTVCGSKTEY